MIDTINIEIEKVKQSKIDQVDFDSIQFGRVYTDHMFLADYIDGDWRNFRIQPYDYLKVSPANPAIHYGQSVFEGLKAYRNTDGEVLIFRPMDNFNRINISAERLCIPELPEELFTQALTELIKLDKNWVPSKRGSSLYIRPFIFATDEYVGIRPSDTYKFMIILAPVGAYYSDPVNVKIERNYTRAVSGGTGFAKAAGNYAGSLYPTKLAIEQGYHQLIWTDGIEHEYIEESGTMNIVFVIDNTLVTPTTSDSILDGITRRSVITLARELGYKVEERKVSVKELLSAIRENRLNEAFGVGTAATIAPIKAIGTDEERFDIPVGGEDALSAKILKALDEIRYGVVEDSHGWIMKI